MSVVNNLVWQDLCLLWDKNAGDMPLRCPTRGFLAFFTVVASSQIFPHTARWGLYSGTKVSTFPVFTAL